MLMTTLEIVRHGHDEYAAKGSGLLAMMESFETFFSLKLAYRVFSAAEQFSINLQAKDTTVSEGTRGADLLRSHYVSLRSYNAFTDFYKDVLHSSGGLTDEPVLPRCRKVPRRYDEGCETHRYAFPEHRYRHAYFEVLDYAIGEIVRRFDQTDLAIVREVKSLLIGAAKGKNIPEIPEAVAKYFQGILDLECLKIQLKMLPDAITNAFAGSAIRVKKVMHVRTIVDTLNKSEMYKDMLNQVDKLVRSYLTFPVTSATAERTFSSPHRLKRF